MTATNPADIPQEPVLKPSHQSGKRRSFATFRTVSALILREIGAIYGRSPMGYAWALMSPLFMVIVLAIAFGLFGRVPPLGDSFILYYASGFLMFSIFQQTFNPVRTALIFNKPLLQFPVVTWIDAVFARFILNFFTSTLAYFILIYALPIYTGESSRFDSGIMLETIALMGGLALGLGVFAHYLFLEIKPLGTLWDIVSRVLFIASGVLFMYEDMPAVVQEILWWNPLIHVVSLGRSAVYSHYDATFVSIPYVFTVILVSAALGGLLLRQHHRRILNKR